MPEVGKQRDDEELDEKPVEEENEAEEKYAGVLEGARAEDLSCMSLCGPVCPYEGRGVRSLHKGRSLLA
jgi:hypothetical protein